MIKAKLATPDGAPILILGLSDANIKRLQQNEPILIHLGELGITPDIPLAIIAGRTEESIQAQLAEFFEMPKPTYKKEGE